MVDASVAIKWYVPESASDAALGLLDDEVELSSPDLLYAEVGNILWKKFRRREITQDEGYAALGALRRTPISIHSTGSPQLADHAFRVATEAGSTYYDSLYVSLAALLGCPLVTADRRLFERFQSESLGPFLLRLEDFH